MQIKIEKLWISFRKNKWVLLGTAILIGSNLMNIVFGIKYLEPFDAASRSLKWIVEIGASRAEPMCSVGTIRGTHSTPTIGNTSTIIILARKNNGECVITDVKGMKKTNVTSDTDTEYHIEAFDHETSGIGIFFGENNMSGKLHNGTMNLGNDAISIPDAIDSTEYQVLKDQEIAKDSVLILSGWQMIKLSTLQPIFMMLIALCYLYGVYSVYTTIRYSSDDNN